MEHLSARWARFLAPLALCLLAPNVAHAQRIPDEAIWFAGTSLLAPFVAIPLKMIVLHLLALEVPSARLWTLGAMEWLLRFPIAVILTRTRCW
jgi:hypothetical protein